MFIGPAAVAGRVLQKRVCPSFFYSGSFLGIGSLVFVNFGMVQETQTSWSMTEPDFFRKRFFCLKHWKNGSKLDPKGNIFGIYSLVVILFSL